MASESWRQGTSLEVELSKRPGRFDFFQAVRLLERLDHLRYVQGSEGAHHPVGLDRPPAGEFVKFSATPSLRFPATLIRKIKWPDNDRRLKPEMAVTFMGLTGPSGVLPNHYTELLIKRRRLRDNALRTFLDLFNHRIISFFYHAWEKYRFPFTWERSRRLPEVEDRFTKSLFALTGLGMESLRERADIADETVLYHAGYFARTVHSACALEGLLESYLGLPVTVQQFIGQWLCLELGDRSRLPGSDCPNGQHQLLGGSAMLGGSVFDAQTKFRVMVGPASYQQFRALSPGGEDLQRLVQLVRLAVGPESDFNIQVLLRGDEVPSATLISDEDSAPRLGRNAWIGTFPRARDADDAIYEEASGQPKPNRRSELDGDPRS